MTRKTLSKIQASLYQFQKKYKVLNRVVSFLGLPQIKQFFSFKYTKSTPLNSNCKEETCLWQMFDGTFGIL